MDYCDKTIYYVFNRSKISFLCKALILYIVVSEEEKRPLIKVSPNHFEISLGMNIFQKQRRYRFGVHLRHCTTQIML